MRREIVIPNSIVNVIIEKHCISITGLLGTLTRVLHESIIVKIDDARKMIVYTHDKHISAIHKALIGTTTALICSMIVGVTTGFSKKLQLVGIGYRASITRDVIDLVIGLSHSVKYTLPVEVKATCTNQTDIILTSISKQLVGQVAADLRAIRPPEPFKGKGIRYIDEIIYSKDAKKR